MKEYAIIEQYLSGQWVELVAIELLNQPDHKKVLDGFYDGLFDKKTSYITMQTENYVVRIAPECGPLRATIQER